jgi:hypothetical protein
MVELPNDCHGGMNDRVDDKDGEHSSVKINFFGVNRDSGNLSSLFIYGNLLASPNTLDNEIDNFGSDPKLPHQHFIIPPVYSKLRLNSRPI